MSRCVSAAVLNTNGNGLLIAQNIPNAIAGNDQESILIRMQVIDMDLGHGTDEVPGNAYTAVLLGLLHQKIAKCPRDGKAPEHVASAKSAWSGREDTPHALHVHDASDILYALPLVFSTRLLVVGQGHSREAPVLGATKNRPGVTEVGNQYLALTFRGRPVQSLSAIVRPHQACDHGRTIKQIPLASLSEEFVIGQHTSFNDGLPHMLLCQSGLG
mmetsp:Transcript_64545/g.104411  ORF Transcript_64545/g.104411 Transcript_64545/m.104411 type:complete len:215 (+) Transcript_64545:218-862(+)